MTLGFADDVWLVLTLKMHKVLETLQPNFIILPMFISIYVEKI